MVFILKPQDDANKILESVKEFLAARGMEISERKTKLTATTDGFDFLGWNFQVQKNGKFTKDLSPCGRPSVDNYEAFRKKVKAIINSSNYGAIVKAEKLAPIVKGWRNYHRYCKMDGARNSLNFIRKRAFNVFNREKKQRGKANYLKGCIASKAFGDLDNYLFKRQVRFVNRTHPKKNSKWGKDKYWGRLNIQRKDNWVFGDKQTGNYMLKFSWTKIERHPLVSKRASPDDPSLTEYWEKRSKRSQKSKVTKWNAKQEQVAYKQGYKCPICKQSLFNDEELHLHHIIPRSESGKDTLNNLVWLHLFCHHKIYHQKIK